MHFAPMFEIGNEVDFVMSEVKRLRLRYPGVLVAPMPMVAAVRMTVII